MLTLIGMGFTPQDITLRGIRAMQQCDILYLESYTSVLPSLEELRTVCKKEIIFLDRPDVESDFLLQEAMTKKVALLVMGDPFAATTHSAMILEARARGIDVIVIHNASILTAIGETGLSLYKFGRVISLVYDVFPLSVYAALRDNQNVGLHTLCLLDVQSDKKRYMTIHEGIKQLQSLEDEKKENIFSPSTIALGIARLGAEDQMIKAETFVELKKIDFGAPPHCIIIPAKQLHFIEEEWIRYWRNH